MRISVARAIVRNPSIVIIEELENTDQVILTLYSACYVTVGIQVGNVQ